MAKSNPLKFSVGKEERSLILIANFVEGFSTDFFFKLPSNFRDALDIKITPKMIHGKQVSIYTQGKNYSFKQGDVVYDEKEAYTLKWIDALQYFNYCIQILDSRDASEEVSKVFTIKEAQIELREKNGPNKLISKDMVISKYKYDPGFVKFKLFETSNTEDKLIAKSVYECSQYNFVLFLQSGILRTIDKKEITLKKE